MAGKKTFDFTGMFENKPTEQPKETTKTGGSQYISKKTGEAYGKHNFAFSDATFAKLKLLGRKTGMPQHALLDVIITRYIDEYETKFGKLTADAELL